MPCFVLMWSFLDAAGLSSGAQEHGSLGNSLPVYAIHASWAIVLRPDGLQKLCSYAGIHQAFELGVRLEMQGAGARSVAPAQQRAGGGPGL